MVVEKYFSKIVMRMFGLDNYSLLGTSIVYTCGRLSYYYLF